MLQGELVKLLAAVVVGGAIGFEREIRDKPAGFRTMILIAVGAALYTILSVRIAGERGDPARVAAQIITGVGFLGAGSILRERKHVMGLTTAAAIWLVASLGMGAGIGAFDITLTALVLVLVVLFGFSKLERLIAQRRDERAYDISVRSLDDMSRMRDLAQVAQLRINRLRLHKRPSAIHVVFHAVGSADCHDAFSAKLAVDPTVSGFTQD